MMIYIRRTQTVWLAIEVSCFYMYLYATVVYLFGMMMKSTCQKTKHVSDFKKAVLDVISYANINLTWFSLNFVLCAMPPFCIFNLEYQVQTHPNMLAGNTGSYIKIMYLLWATHVITFLPKLRIFRLRVSTAETPLNDDNDDDYHRASD